MQISGHGRAKELASLLLGGQDVERPNKGTEAPVSHHQDQVHISRHAKEILELRALADSADDVRAQKVEDIRKALDSGTYDMSGRTIADSLIRHIATDSVL